MPSPPENPDVGLLPQEPNLARLSEDVFWQAPSWFGRRASRMLGHVRSRSRLVNLPCSLFLQPLTGMTPLRMLIGAPSRDENKDIARMLFRAGVCWPHGCYGWFSLPPRLTQTRAMKAAGLTCTTLRAKQKQVEWELLAAL